MPEDAQLIYPTHEHNPRYLELGQVRSDILGKAGKLGLFTGAYRFRRFFLELLARKYGASLDEYGEEPEEDALVLGPDQCQNALKNPKSVALAKIAQFFDSNTGIFSKVLGLLVLEADYSDENRQKFLIRTPKKIFLRDQGLNLLCWPVKGVSIGKSGLTARGKNYLAGVLVDPRFVAWHRELELLATPPLRADLGWHAFAAELTKLPRDAAAAMAEPYMRLLVCVAMSGNSLDAFSALRLETMAANFGMREDLFYSLFQKVASAKINVAKLQKMLNAALSSAVGMDPHVLYLDILETAHTHEGKCRCPEIVDILRGPDYADEEFTRLACESIVHAHKAQAALSGACRSVANPGQLYDQHFYMNSLNSMLLNLGGKI